MRGLGPVLVIGFLVVGIAAGGRVSASRSDESLERLLPAGNETAGWKAMDKPQVFNKETLFDYIDGGAEIYLEYGFRQLVVQEYRNEAGGSVVIEVFEMESSPSALGMYTFKSASAGSEVSIGQGGQLADYYLNFWKGNYLVTLTGSDETATTLEGLKTLGAAVAGRIPVTGDAPQALSLLPEQGRAAMGLKYFRGPLGVYNSYAFFTEDVFGVKEAAKADYNNGYSLYLFLYGSRDESRMRFASVEKAFQHSGRYTGFSAMGESGFLVRDVKGRTIMALASGPFILASVGADDPMILEQAAAAVRSGEGHKEGK
jgi:hypothetical protein